MYVILCEIKAHTSNGDVLIAAHPVDTAETEEQCKEWMLNKPGSIIEDLNKASTHQWEKGDCNELQAQLWNKEHTIERIYSSMKV